MQFTNFLGGQNIALTPRSEDLIFQRFNKRQKPDRINYAEFIEEITPRSTVFTAK